MVTPLARASSVNSNRVIPELDITYFTPNIAAEIPTYPQKHDVRSFVAGDLGTLKHLPPTAAGPVPLHQLW